MIGKISIAVALIALGIFYLNSSTSVNYEDEFVRFIQEHRRSYFSKDEYKFRLGVFTENLKEIERKNADETDPAEYGVNDFADWTHEEF